MNFDQLARNEGLPNNGNTCFLNSVIQSLYAIDSFREYIINDNGQKKFALLIKSIFLGLQQGINAKERQKRMKNLVTYLTKCDIDYQGYSQEDSSQFLLLILDNLFQQSPQIQRFFKVYYKFNCLSCDKSLKLKEYMLSKFYALCENKLCRSDINMKLINKPKAIIYCGNPYSDQDLSVSHVSDGKICFSIVSQILYSGTGRSGHYVCRRRLTQKKESFKIFNDSSVEDQTRRTHFQSKIQIFELRTIEKEVQHQISEAQPAAPIMISKTPQNLKEISKQVKKQQKSLLINWLKNNLQDFFENMVHSSG